MALTIGEAQDVNSLLNWLLGIRPEYTEMTDEELATEARAAAERLADKANKALSAGLNGKSVNEAWRHVEVGPWQEPATAAQKPCERCGGRGFYFELGGDPCRTCQTTGKVPANG